MTHIDHWFIDVILCCTYLWEKSLLENITPYCSSFDQFVYPCSCFWSWNMNYTNISISILQECGPRFTLKLISLQHGTFDTKGGEYEWVHKVIFLFPLSHSLGEKSSLLTFCFSSPQWQPEMDTSRRRFFLWCVMGGDFVATKFRLDLLTSFCFLFGHLNINCSCKHVALWLYLSFYKGV